MQGFALLSLFLGYVSALPVYKAPMNFGGNSGGWNNNYGGMGNGAGGTGEGPPIVGQSSSSYVGPDGGGNGLPVGGGGGGNVYVSSSESDYDSAPSDGGGDTNPTAPTLGPGGYATTQSNALMPLQLRSTGVKTAGLVLALGLIVGVCVGVAVHLIRKNS